MKAFLSCCAAIGSIAASATLLTLGAPAKAQTYTNPILDENVPDPATLRVGGTLYVYATGAKTGSSNPAKYIQMTKSTDLINWTPTTTVLILPSWATGDTWAPDVIKDPSVANRYVMYFSAKGNQAHANVPDNADKCIGVAVASSPDGPFTAQPAPLLCGSGGREIDPMAFYDNNESKWFLFWGSSSTVPMSRRALSANLLTFAAGSTTANVISAIPGDPYSSLVEAAWLLDRGAYRYLFMSGKHCCMGDDDYAVTVARKSLSNLSGPWVRYTGGQNGAILRRNVTWQAPGHNAVFVDGAGHHWMVYHARRPNAPNKRVLMMDRITWQNGWPRIANDSPSTGAVAAPVP
ncbi:family 43 glycosylhydrolase [Sphingomonas suaedae]|uniref:Family 43 glycosylhydrolase n=1 Tax=Sphingomonas suaedae TaxID=2599297 RepID=A0A518RHJ2_9SPHN|nr:glycoside hydrolase family 43 protein [Sphingomonas suaedae]QDX26905.1 family 43 glycosylhydrolase [Sphingomonas suaedae]